MSDVPAVRRLTCMTTDEFDLESTELRTWYIPKGETHHVQPVMLREGNGEARPVWSDDRGTLLMVARIEEADHDGLLLWKQYQADRLVRSLAVLAASDRLDPEHWVRVSRSEGGSWYEVEPVTDPDATTVESAEDAM